MLKKLFFTLPFLALCWSLSAQKYPYDFPVDTTISGTENIHWQNKSGSTYTSYNLPFSHVKKYMSPNVVTSAISFVPDTASTGAKYNYLGKFVTDPNDHVWYISGTGGVIDLGDPAATGGATDTTALRTDINNLQTLSGRADGSTHMGTYTGSTITDNQTAKQNIQQLETAVETKLSAEVDGSTTNELTAYTAAGTPPGSPKQGDRWAGYTGDSIFIRNSGAWVFDAVRTATGGGGGSLSSATNPTGGENLYQGTAVSTELEDYISGDRIPVAQNEKMRDTVSIPHANFSYISIPIWNNGDGTYSTAVDNIREFRDSFLIGQTEFGNDYYVDGIRGDDSYAGTKTAPWRTFAPAAAATGVRILYVKGGHVYNTSDFTPNQDTISLIGYEGTPIICGASATPTWTATTLSNVYKATFSGATVVRVLDFSKTGDLGEPIELKSNGSDTTGLVKKSGYYCFIGTTVYIHNLSGTAPTSSTNVVVNNGSATHAISATAKAYYENIQFLDRVSFSSTSGKCYIKDCNFFYNASSNLISFDTPSKSGRSIMSGCKIAHSYTDMIDYAGGIKGIEIKCQMQYAGLIDAANRNQNTTAHDSSTITRIENICQFFSDEAAYDVNTGYSWTVGGYYGNEWNNTDAGVTTCLGSAIRMYIEGAKTGGATDDDFGGASGADIRIRKMKINSTTRLLSTATIVKY